MEIFYVLLKSSDYNEFITLFEKFGKILKKQIMLIPLFMLTEIKEGYILEIEIEINASGIKQLEKSMKLREMIYWLSSLDKKLYHIRDIISEMCIKEDFYILCKENNPEESFLKIFEKNLNKEEKLYKWFKLLYFMKSTNFEKKLKNRTSQYFIDLIENENEKIYLRLGNSTEFLNTSDLSLNDSLFFSKQKILIKQLEEINEEYPENFFEILLQKILKISKGIEIVNPDKQSYIKISQFQFIRYFSEKFKLINLRMKEIEIGVCLLENLLEEEIWELFQFKEGILNDGLVKFGNAENKYENMLKNFGIKSITALSELISVKFETFIKDLEEGCLSNTLKVYRLRYLNYMLKFNHKLVYQKRIQNLIKTCYKENETNSKLLNLETYVMEIKYLNQIQNFQKIKHIKNVIECVKGIKCDFLIEELKYQKKTTLVLEEIDNNLFYIENILPKEFEYRKDNLYLKIIVVFKSNIDELKIQDILMTLKTENENLSKIETIILEEIILKKGNNHINVEIIYPFEYQRKLNYLILNKMNFIIGGIKYNLLDFDKIQRKNININEIPYFAIKNSGFIHKFGDNQIFFEEANPNYFFIDFSIYNNKNNILKDIKIEIQKSSKYLIIDKEIEILNENCQKSVLLNDCEINLEDLTCGNYLMLLKIYILQKKNKNYKLKLNLFYNGKQVQNYLNLKNPKDKLYYLKTRYNIVNEKFSQLVLKNNFQGQKIQITSINDKKLDSPKVLAQNEEFSKIINSFNSESINLTYIIEGLFLMNLKEHVLIKKYLPRLLLEKSKIETKIFYMENLLKNNEININSLKIKNNGDLKIYEQNVFLINYSFKKINSKNDSILFLELKWPKDKYIIVGTTRFELNEDVDNKIKEITFLNIDSGFTFFPKLMLVEIKKDGSEHQHLLNDFQTSKKFFIKENMIKACKFENEE